MTYFVSAINPLRFADDRSTFSIFCLQIFKFKIILPYLDLASENAFNWVQTGLV